jgi:hypothetical protein
MPKDLTPHRWFQAWRADEVPPKLDPADLGTAFGLDLSLDELAHEPAPVPPPVARRPGWVSRLAGRRKPLA